MQFQDPIAAGTVLVRPALQSPDYETGVSGWAVKIDGTAEFSDLTIRSSDGSGATVVIENGRAEFTAANDWKIIIDPTRPDAPVIYFTDETDYVVGSINAAPNDRAALYVASGEMSDGVTDDWKWVQFLGETALGVQQMNSYRTRQSDQEAAVGGWVYLGDDIAQYGLADTETPSVQTIFQVTEGLFILDAGRVIVDARPSASSALRVTVDDPGHTGNLFLLQREGVGYFQVDKDGHAIAAGDVTALGTLIADDGLIVTDVDQGRGYRAFQARSTATAASATEQIALTQAGVSIASGRAYRLKVRGLAQNDTANTGVRVRIRKTNTAGQIWLDTFTITTPVGGANYQFNNEQVIRNDTGATIVTDLVMTYVRVAAGNAFLNAGNGLYIAFDVTDIGASADFPTAQPVT